MNKPRHHSRRPTNRPRSANPFNKTGSPNRGVRRPPPRPQSANPGQDGDTFRIIERPTVSPPAENKQAAPGPFRIIIAVHRPRFRGRAERAAALTGWQVTSLLNKQDPVGLCARAPGPPDLLILSGDFGRQKDLAIFRAVQRYREHGLTVVGLIDDCDTAPEGFPDSVPADLCDVCLTPPYKAADLRAVFTEIYVELRGEPAPPPLTKGSEADDSDGEEDGEEEE